MCCIAGGNAAKGDELTRPQSNKEAVFGHDEEAVLQARASLSARCPLPASRQALSYLERVGLSRVILSQCSFSPARRMGLRPLLLLLHVRVHCLVVKMKESGKSLQHVKSSFSCIALKVSSGTIAPADRRVSTASKWFNAMRKARQSKTKRRVV